MIITLAGKSLIIYFSPLVTKYLDITHQNIYLSYKMSLTPQIFWIYFVFKRKQLVQNF